MHSILEFALMNAVMVIPLAIMAAIAGRFLRRPALSHLLWIAVLIKLLTPPIYQLPLIDRQWAASVVRPWIPPVAHSVDRALGLGATNSLMSVAGASLTGLADVSASGDVPRPNTLAGQNQKIATSNSPFLAFLIEGIRNRVLTDYLTSALVVTWAVVGMAWFTFQGIRCMRFRRRLAYGCEAPAELQQYADQFARQLGLGHSPQVWLMPGVMSPMLWSTGRSKLLIFPEQLLDRLDREATGTLLIHELAHFRRRDHWVRVLELMATGFFWWHPVVWWARRQIEAVEEECCDALVVSMMDGPPKQYAQAILEAVDFLADFHRLPPLATGLSQFPFLRQRLTWIMRGPRRQDYGYLGRLFLLVVACNMPFQPTWVVARTASVPENVTSESESSADEFDSSALTISDVSASTMEPEDEQMTISLISQQDLPSRWAGMTIRSHSYDMRFVILTNKATQILLDLETGRDFDLSPFEIAAVAFAPNTNEFATIDGDRFLRLWNAENCDLLQTWQMPGGKTKSVDISRDGRWLVTGGRDGVVRIWSTSSQRPVREFANEGSQINCVRFSPDSNQLAIATGEPLNPRSGRIALFEVGTWAERISMNQNSASAALAFRNDSESIVSGDWEGRIARWSLETGELLGLTNAPVDLLLADAFSPNGSPLLDIDVPELNQSAIWRFQDASNRKSSVQGWLILAPATNKNADDGTASP